MYLPAYSPNLNPIEEAFAKVKGILRKAEAKSMEALIEAMGRALDAITSRDVRSFFEHCRYRVRVNRYHRCNQQERQRDHITHLFASEVFSNVVDRARSQSVLLLLSSFD